MQDGRAERTRRVAVDSPGVDRAVGGGSDDPAKSLAPIGIEQPLIAHGGFNFGAPPELVTGDTVANEAFFIRSHGPSATLDDPAKYSLTIGGHVDTPLTLSLDDLNGMPQRSYTAFLECSGNSRGFFAPAAKGGQWRNDAIGNAEWSGVPLHEVLVQAGVKDGAVDVVSQGAISPSWNEATITQNDGEHAWARFEYSWDATPGPTGLLTLATDDRGASQPAQVPWNQLGYQYNAVQRVLVTVTA